MAVLEKKHFIFENYNDLIFKLDFLKSRIFKFDNSKSYLSKFSTDYDPFCKMLTKPTSLSEATITSKSKFLTSGTYLIYRSHRNYLNDHNLYLRVVSFFSGSLIPIIASMGTSVRGTLTAWGGRNIGSNGPKLHSFGIYCLHPAWHYIEQQQK